MRFGWIDPYSALVPAKADGVEALSVRKPLGSGILTTKPWMQTPDGVTLDVRLTPRGGRDAIEGVERRADGRAVLKARVRAAPFEGQANAALCRLVAQELAIAPRQVEIAAGESARVKRLRITGDPRMLEAMLERLSKGSAKGSK